MHIFNIIIFRPCAKYVVHINNLVKSGALNCIFYVLLLGRIASLKEKFHYEI